MTVCLSCDQKADIAYYKTVTRKLHEFFDTNPCVDCGEQDHELLDFANQGIWKMIEQRTRWTLVNSAMRASEPICVSCMRRRIAARAGPWGLKSQ